MIKTQLFIGAALIVGVAIGYFAGGHGAAVAPSSEKPTPAVSKHLADHGDEASVRALRKRVKELEELLAARDLQSEVAISNAVAAAAKAPPPRFNPREMMENIRKTDPARYTQMTNRIEQWRLRREARTRSTMEFLSSIDTSQMSKDVRKVHDDLLALIERRAELEAQIHGEGTTDDERWQLIRELGSTHRELQKLNAAERYNLLGETAKALGFEGEDAKEVVDAVQEVIRATDSGWGGHGGGRGRGGQRGPGGPGGPGGGLGGAGGR